MTAPCLLSHNFPLLVSLFFNSKKEEKATQKSLEALVQERKDGRRKNSRTLRLRGFSSSSYWEGGDQDDKW